MQTSEPSNQKKSLFNAMSRFVGAVNNMDQTVMVPSLLRDVPLDSGKELGAVEAGGGGGGACLQQDGDMYSSYVLLKSIRDDMERGVLQGDEWRRDKEDEDDDLEQLFHFHLNGLHAVLSQLTRRANALTRRYKEEIGYRN